MLQTGSHMLTLWALGLVGLLGGFTTVSESAPSITAASNNNGHRKTSVDKDIIKAVCCENRLCSGAGLSCCGELAYNPAAATCCEVKHGHTVKANITEGLSTKVSSCCALQAFNPLNEICCKTRVLAKPGANAQCCDKEVIDSDKQLCCGPPGNKTILNRTSTHHQCCGHDQFNTKTHCCCLTNEALKKHLINSTCCREESALSGTMSSSPFKSCGTKVIDSDKQLCCGPTGNKTILNRTSTHHQCCGHDQFNTKTHCCAFTNGALKIHLICSTSCREEQGVQQPRPGPQTSCTEPQTSLCGSSCYNPKEFRCCVRNHTQCAPGQGDAAPTLYNPRTHVCCDGHVSELKQQTDQFHGSPGHRCCGTEIYWPRDEICCNGHRHCRKVNMHCCGDQTYNINDPHMKCCAGTLYNLTLLGKLGHDQRCCGSILQKPQDVCCASEDMEVLYSAKTGLRCCGHLYYNTSLWSCCAGKLVPIQQPGHHQNKMTRGSRLQSLVNLNETDLCEEMLIGTVESVSLRSIVFSSVVKIHGGKGTLNPLSSPHMLEISDYCSSPQLIPGKTYFFNEVNVFTDFNHDSISQSLYFIISKCYRCKVSTT